MTAPSILIIDDGELDRLQALLERIQVDWMRCLDADGSTPLERPRDLIVSSGPRAMKMPPLTGDGSPLWVCIYDQDFLPLREQLRDRGVHYLVSGDLAPRTLELFVRQLLHRGEERRQVRRIPLHCELALAANGERREVLLLELSRESCVFAAREPIPERRRVSLRMPAELTGDVDMDLTGTVIRCVGAAGHGEERTVTTVVRFEALDGDAMARIHHVLSGNALGTQVTPLHDEPGVALESQDVESWVLGAGHVFEDSEPELLDRRKAPRRRYAQRVDAIRWAGKGELPVALGKDLSVEGMCIVASPQPPLDSEISLALYGRSREEPLLIGARVVRLHRDEIGLRFIRVNASQVRTLERLISAAPCVEDLHVPRGSRYVVELTRR